MSCPDARNKGTFLHLSGRFTHSPVKNNSFSPRENCESRRIDQRPISSMIHQEYTTIRAVVTFIWIGKGKWRNFFFQLCSFTIRIDLQLSSPSFQCWHASIERCPRDLFHFIPPLVPSSFLLDSSFERENGPCNQIEHRYSPQTTGLEKNWKRKTSERRWLWNWKGNRKEIYFTSCSNVCSRLGLFDFDWKAMTWFWIAFSFFFFFQSVKNILLSITLYRNSSLFLLRL